MVEKLELLHSFTIEHWEREKAHLVQDTEHNECVKQHSATSEYWEAKRALKNLEDMQHRLAQEIEQEQKASLNKQIEVLINNKYHSQHEQYFGKNARIVSKPNFLVLMSLMSSIMLVRYML